MKKIVFILPVYNAERFIDQFHTELTKALSALKSKYQLEYIYINDGSPDGSLEKLTKIIEADKQSMLINFSRNFGHQAAITAGLDYAKADAVVIMDTDLQDPPKVVLDLVSKWEEGYDVVYAKRKTRDDPFLKKLSAGIFYRVLNMLSDIEIPRDTGEFRIIDERVLHEIKKFREANRFMRGLISYVGFRQTAVLFDREKRYAGKGEYTIKKMFKLAADGMTSFSTVPLRLISQAGALVSLVSFFGIIYALVVRFLYPIHSVPGWAFTVISIFFFSGVQLLMLGILGLYIGRIYSEVQNRPLYIVESERGNKERQRVA